MMVAWRAKSTAWAQVAQVALDDRGVGEAQVTGNDGLHIQGGAHSGEASQIGGGTGLEQGRDRPRADDEVASPGDLLLSIIPVAAPG